MVTPTMGDPNSSIGMSDLVHVHIQEEDHEISDSILTYINQMLMEEVFEEEDREIQESLEFKVAEKSLYDAIGKTYPASPIHNSDCPSEDLSCFSNGYSSELTNMNCAHEFSGSIPVSQNSQSISSFSSSLSSVKDGLLESPISSSSSLQIPDLYDGFQSVSLFIKGVEESRKLIPNHDELFDALKGKKHRNKNFRELEKEETSCRKQAAVNPDPNEHSDLFDEILLNHAGGRNKTVNDLRETLKSESIKKTMQQNPKGRGGRRKQSRKKVMDFRTLLMNCAQSVTNGDHRRATDLLAEIKQSSSPFGDGNQRMAHCFANGLEARLSGNGIQVYRTLISNRISSTGILKAYLLYLASCPFRKVSNLFSNRTISKLTHNAPKIHIIEFGTLYGFQWPAFIQHQSERVGGSPKIRITGIDFPQPGFRPAQRVEETGQRLAHYAKEFGVPFEFNPVAKNWESIQLKDLKLEEDEIVIVNCVYRMKNLPDETMLPDCSRNAIFKLIRKIKPAVFIQGVINGAYNGPFFLTRFKEALFHFSSLFDMLETVMPRESEERLLLEREILGREALNVVGCEGIERVERPETYKQWQARTCRAGFLQLPLDEEIKDRARLRVSAYHKEFVIDQDRGWLLLGWKGRIVYALSTWKPD